MKIRVLLSIFMCSIIMYSCNDENPISMETEDEIPVIDLEKEVATTLRKSTCTGIEIVCIGGKVRNFGWNMLTTPPAPKPLTGIQGVKVWFAEYPFTKLLNITTDKDGMWKVFVIKKKGQNIQLSFLYEKNHYTSETERLVFPQGLPETWSKVTIKSNVHTIGSESITDCALQMPDEIFLFYAKSGLESGISHLIGTPYTINNLAVATVGKAWASIYDERLPHGDPGCTVILDPAPMSPVQGPVYFDETVTPNPTVRSTSVDGGVLFNNLTPGTYTMTAQKVPYSYDEIIFNVEQSINVYIASPPHAIQGTNTSGPGEN